MPAGLWGCTRCLSELSIPCPDVDECAENPCHPAAACHNSLGSFSCQCQPGYEGDGFQCAHGKAWSSPHPGG